MDVVDVESKAEGLLYDHPVLHHDQSVCRVVAKPHSHLIAEWRHVLGHAEWSRNRRWLKPPTAGLNLVWKRIGDHRLPSR
jgi:hypothetical protein